MLKYLVYIVSILQVASSGKPSLSDPRGLNPEEESRFHFAGLGAGQNYVSGSVWPKPQQETREDVMYSVDPSKFE